jgi:helicase MOV-10
MHAALDTTIASPRLLFPQEDNIIGHRPSQEMINALTPLDPGIGSNPPQMLAVTAILNLPPGSPPFVVFGP